MAQFFERCIYEETEGTSASLHEMLIIQLNQIFQIVNNSTTLKTQFHLPPARAACPIGSFFPR